MTESFPTFRKWFGKLRDLVRTGEGAGRLRDLLPPPWRLSPWRPGEGRAARQRTTLRMIAAGAANQVPLAPVADALAREHRWFYRGKLHALARRLSGGIPLADALEQTPGVVADEAVLAARFGSESGTLAASLAEIAERDESAALAVRRRYRTGAWYFFGLGAALIVVSTFMLVRVVPSFVEIFGDFSLETPSALQAFIATGRAFHVVLPVVFFGAALLLFALVVTRGGLARWLSRSVYGRAFRPVASLRIGQLWSCLSTASAAGRPLAGAVSTLARYHYDPSIRRRLLFVRNELDHGAELFGSLAAVGLAPPAEVVVIQRAEPGDERTWTLRQLAQARRDRTLARLDRWADVLFPAAVIVVGLAVLLVAVAIMAPLNNLVGGLS